MRMGLSALIECLYELRDWAHVVSQIPEHVELELERVEPCRYGFDLGDGICDNICGWMSTHRRELEAEARVAFEYLTGPVFGGQLFPVEKDSGKFCRPGKWTGERGRQRRLLIDRLIEEAKSCLEYEGVEPLCGGVA